MYDGDERANRYIDEHVVPRALRLGITVERVPVADTADVVQRLIAEQRAGRECSRPAAAGRRSWGRPVSGQQ